MLQHRYENIKDVATLFNEASALHARTLRMQPENDNKPAAISPRAISALFRAAEKLEVVSRLSYSARGVVFMQKEPQILTGTWSLKQIEAQSAVGYIARQARKAAISQGYFA